MSKEHQRIQEAKEIAKDDLRASDEWVVRVVVKTRDGRQSLAQAPINLK